MCDSHTCDQVPYVPGLTDCLPFLHRGHAGMSSERPAVRIHFFAAQLLPNTLVVCGTCQVALSICTAVVFV